MKIKRNLLIAMFCGIFCIAAFGKPTSQVVNQLIQQYTPTAFVGINIINAKTGKTIFQRNAFNAFQPASNTKILTAIAALLYLGPDYQYETSVYINPAQLKSSQLEGNLYIKFSGDPSLRKKNLAQLIQTVSNNNIKTIKGNIILDNSRFEKPYYGLGMTREDSNWYYGAPASTIILDQNYATLNLYPSKKIGGLATIEKRNNMAYMPLTYRIVTVSAEKAARHCRLLVDISKTNHLKMSGCWPVKGAYPELNLAFKNPTLFASQVIRKALKENQITLQGKIITGIVSKQATKIIAKHDSPSMKLLIRTMMKRSNNLYAQILSRTIGEKYYHHPTIQDGANAIKHILQTHTQIDFPKKSDLYGGAGNRYNLLTPDQISRVLFVAYHSTIKNNFMNSLPQSGKNIDGTLKYQKAYRDFLPEGIHAKTGSFKGVVNLSGYMIPKSKTPVIFSILINNNVGSSRNAVRLQAALCQYFSQSL